MSLMGQSRKLARLNGMSVLPSTADVIGSLRHVRFVPLTDVALSWLRTCRYVSGRSFCSNPSGNRNCRQCFHTLELMTFPL